MTDATALLFGITLGLRHATDADHLVVVTALVQREPGVSRAVRVAALWAVGHTLTFLGLGLLIVVGGLQLPAGFERAAEVLVAAMLIGLGVVHLARGCAPERLQRVTYQGGVVHDAPPLSSAAPAVETRDAASRGLLFRARPALIGLVHGLAGSAGVALLAATTLPSTALAAAYLALVAAGTMFGMLALTVIMARPLGWTVRRQGRLRQVVVVGASLLSVWLGASALL